MWGEPGIFSNALGTRSFQLTRPVWGEPYFGLPSTIDFLISTHSPRVGRTLSRTREEVPSVNFNSLAPCGANHSELKNIFPHNSFQLTRPVWGEPLRLLARSVRLPISTHSPRVGRTIVPRPSFTCFGNFNSLAPCGANLCAAASFGA